MITQQDINFIKREKNWLYEEDEEGAMHTNPTMWETINKPLDEINKTEADIHFLQAWLKRLKERQDENMIPFVWNEGDVINNKVFPIDYNKDLFFYGLLIPKNVDHEVKGKKYGKKQIWSPCLITSDRKLLEVDETLKEKLSVGFENIPAALPRRWTLEKIKTFLTWKDEEINNEELLKKISGQYEKYLFIRNSTWYKIHALWDLGTYLYQIFEAYPFLELRGIAGTGKSKCMVISSYITFNGGQIMVNPSESTLFRETDEVRGTKYFDEAEKLWVFNKSTKQYEGDVRTELINASYTKESKVPRQEKIVNKFVTKWYSPYSPTMLGSINGLYGATETRAITRITTKSSNEDQRGELEPSEGRSEPIWEEIRDECYRFTLNNWKKIKELYNNFPKEIGLKRRDYQIWKPILTLAKFISEDLFNEILKFAKEMTNRRIDDLIQESSFDYLCLHALKNAISSNTISDKIHISEISLKYLLLKGEAIDKKDAWLNRTIAQHLDKLGFKELRDRDKNGNYYVVTKEIFNEIVNPICPNLSENASYASPSSSSIVNSSKKGEARVKIDEEELKETSKKGVDSEANEANEAFMEKEEDLK